jgi:photosystem II stability/assembly factor-like uncharacterized protein
MNRLTALLLVILFGACSAAPAAIPSATATVAVASPTPTATPAATTAPPTPTAPPTAPPTLIPLPNTAQIDASGSVVWVIVGEQTATARLFRSTDRGDSWQERPAPPKLPVVVSFIDDHEGWALVQQGFGVPPPAGGACAAPSVTVQHTSDGGTTWQDLNATGMGAGPCKTTLRFADALHGYISAFDPNGSPVVYRSADGGRTWTASRPLADPPGFTTKTGGGTTLGVGRVGSFGATLLVTAFPTNPTTGAIYAYRSTDAGATWTYASKAPNPTQDVAFVTATRWLQISSPGDAKETTDGGATWHAYVTTYQQAAPIGPAVTFGDAQVGYATVRGAIQRTIDGGAHWTSIRTPGTF